MIVAFSGGVDSSVLLAVAHEELGARALGVIGVSDSYAAHELELALAQAAAIGARVETVTTGELADEAFASNPIDRCYHCKHAFFALARVAAREEEAARNATASEVSAHAAARQRGSVTVIDGTIHDDLSDHRPGRLAAGEYDVRSTLAELGFTKRDVRAVAEALGLASAEKPASPCLASRIPYGTAITRENLSQVERAEALLRELGFRELRVRHHGEIARLEVPLGDLARLRSSASGARIEDSLKALGFRWVTLDLEGLRSGNLNPPARRSGPHPTGPVSPTFPEPSSPGRVQLAAPRQRRRHSHAIFAEVAGAPGLKRPGPAPAISNGRYSRPRTAGVSLTLPRGATGQESGNEPEAQRHSSQELEGESCGALRWISGSAGACWNTVLLGSEWRVLAAGYMSLAKGSLTLAPVLLVTGYCVLIPASLLVRGSGSNEGE